MGLMAHEKSPIWNISRNYILVFCHLENLPLWALAPCNVRWLENRGKSVTRCVTDEPDGLSPLRRLFIRPLKIEKAEQWSIAPFLAERRRVHVLWSTYFYPRSYLKLALVARGSREAGFTPPLREKFALLSIYKFQRKWKTSSFFF